MYADFVCAREGHAQDLKPKDPRTEEDKMASIELLKANKEKLKQGKELSLSEHLGVTLRFSGSKWEIYPNGWENNIGDMKNM